MSGSNCRWPRGSTPIRRMEVATAWVPGTCWTFRADPARDRNDAVSPPRPMVRAMTTSLEHDSPERALFATATAVVAALRPVESGVARERSRADGLGLRGHHVHLRPHHHPDLSGWPDCSRSPLVMFSPIRMRYLGELAGCRRAALTWNADCPRLARLRRGLGNALAPPLDTQISQERR